jgi:hypothetical protein
MAKDLSQDLVMLNTNIVYLVQPPCSNLEKMIAISILLRTSNELVNLNLSYNFI